MEACKTCGKENTDGAKFCSGCGRPLLQEAGPSSMRCAACGAENTPGSKFCTGCGKPFSAQPQAPAQAVTDREGPAPALPKKKTPWWGYLIIPASVFVLLWLIRSCSW